MKEKNRLSSPYVFGKGLRDVVNFGDGNAILN